MTPTRTQIEKAYLTYSADPQHGPALKFMYEAALDRLHSEPFKAGEIVISNINDLRILVGTEPGLNEDVFPGMVIGGTVEQIGHYSKDWAVDKFTKEITNDLP